MSINNLLLFVSYCIFLCIIKEIINEKYITLFLKSVSILVLLLSIFAIYQFFWGYKHTYLELLPFKDDFLISKTLTYLKNRRVSSTFALPTTFAAFQMISLPWLILNAKNSTYLYKILSCIIVFLSLFSAILSQSFFVAISFLIMLLVLVFLKNPPLSKRIAFLIIILLIGISLFVSFYLRKDISSDILKSNTIQMRLGNWRIAKDIIMNNIIWGVGIGNFQLYYPKYMTNLDIETKYAHNFLIQFIAELGIIGFITSIILFLFLIVSFNKIRKSNVNPVRI